MKQFLEDVLAKMKAGENNEAMEMIEAKIAELDNPVQTMDANGNGGDEGDGPLPGEGTNGIPK